MNDRIDMILHCPMCGLQHIDRADDTGNAILSDRHGQQHWTNPPHRSHLCSGCGHIWRPADVATNGVLAIKTKGANDSIPVAPVYFPVIGPGRRGQSFGRKAEGSEILPDRRSVGVTVNPVGVLPPDSLAHVPGVERIEVGDRHPFSGAA